MNKTRQILIFLLLIATITFILGISLVNAASSVVVAPIDSNFNSIGVSVNVINQDPNPAIAGDIMELRLGIQNTGGTAADNLNIEMLPQYPFTLVPGQDSIIDVGTIDAYQGQSSNLKEIKYRIQVDRNTPAGTYDLSIRYYSAGENAYVFKTIPIDVKTRESAEVIHIDKTVLIPGQQSSLKFIINNVGNAPLRELTFSWDNTDKIVLPVGSDNTRYVKYIDIGNSSELEYQVIADTNAQAGLYQLNLHLTYENSLNNSQKTISTTAGVYVGGSTDFDIAFSDNSNGQVSFTVANIGSNPANSVSVSIPQQRGWSVTGPNAVIIGNLNKGDYTVASFTLQSPFSSNRTARTGSGSSSRFGSGSGANSNTGTDTNQGMYFQRNETGNFSNILSIQIAYTDTMGIRQTITKELRVNPQNFQSGSVTGTLRNGTSSAAQQNFFAQYQWYLVAIVVVIIAFFGYRKYKKNKLMNPNYKPTDIMKAKKK